MTLDFMREAARILNSQQTNSLLVTGNIADLFPLQTKEGEKCSTLYSSLHDLFWRTWVSDSLLLISYRLNGPIKFQSLAQKEILKNAWKLFKNGGPLDDFEKLGCSKTEDIFASQFDQAVNNVIGRPTLALETLRQICMSMSSLSSGHRLVIIIEDADLLIPEGEISRLSDVDRTRVALCQDWFSSVDFMSGCSQVLLFSESRSLLNRRISSMPQLVELEIPDPDYEGRLVYIKYFLGAEVEKRGKEALQIGGTPEDLASLSAGLSLHALRQLLMDAIHREIPVSMDSVVKKVESHISSRLGPDVVEFKRPTHKIDDLIGFRRLKNFLREELIPRFKENGEGGLSGAAVGGPIGSGKTFIFEAVASELGMLVLVLRNIRSKWFGETDIIFERLRRVLLALSKVVIFVDEADTQFGGVDAGTHETEKRLTGKIQAMMSDPRLKGQVIWLLMTARIEALSPDIRRPGRVGDLIIPVLDPMGEDLRDFIKWMIGNTSDLDNIERLEDDVKGFFPAVFASLRSELKYKAKIKGANLTYEEVKSVISDRRLPNISETRKEQTLQALRNCTRKSLVPEDLWEKIQ